MKRSRWIRLKFELDVTLENPYEPFDTELYFTVADNKAWTLSPVEERFVLTHLASRSEKTDVDAYINDTFYDKSRKRNRYVVDSFRRFRFILKRASYYDVVHKITEDHYYTILVGAVDPAVRECKIEECRSGKLATVPSVVAV